MLTGVGSVTLNADNDIGDSGLNDGTVSVDCYS